MGGDIDEFAARVAAAPAFGKSSVGRPTDTPWNTREVTVIDPDGRIIEFTHTRNDPTMAARMQQMFEPGQGKK